MGCLSHKELSQRQRAGVLNQKQRQDPFFTGTRLLHPQHRNVLTREQAQSSNVFSVSVVYSQGQTCSIFFQILSLGRSECNACESSLKTKKKHREEMGKGEGR